MRLIPKKRCNICKRLLNDGTLESEDCGGDCLKCVADVGEDPECRSKLYGIKRCIKCDEVKLLSEFHRSSVASTDGYRNVCKCCRRKAEAARIREKRGTK